MRDSPITRYGRIRPMADSWDSVAHSIQDQAFSLLHYCRKSPNDTLDKGGGDTLRRPQTSCRLRLGSETGYERVDTAVATSMSIFTLIVLQKSQGQCRSLPTQGPELGPTLHRNV